MRNGYFVCQILLTTPIKVYHPFMFCFPHRYPHIYHNLPNSGLHAGADDHQEIEEQLALAASHEEAVQGAEEDLEANIIAVASHENEEDEVGGHGTASANVAHCLDDSDEDQEQNFDDAMDSFDAVFVFSDEGDGDDNVKFQEGKSEGSVSMNFSGGTFDEMPAWKFLSSMNMTELPNMKGVGVGVHLTTCCWQIRYPPTSPGKQASVARSWGKLKKGHVSQCKALLQCLLWIWQTHAESNPTCAISKGKVQLLKGALIADLGRDIC